MPQSLVIVLGSANVDLVVHSAHLPRPGETVLGGEFFQSFGGKGANQAVAAARTSQSPVVFIAALGNDAFGSAYLRQLQNENLDCRSLKTIDGVASGIAVIMVSETGENLISVASGANLHLSPDDVDSIDADLLAGARVFVTSLESRLETVRAALKRAKSAGLTTILNPAPADRRILEGDLLAYVDILTPNETEAELLTGIPQTTADDASLAAGKLIEAGCGNVVLTRGADGCVIHDGKTIQQLDAVSVNAVDTTAAGDTFNGALATGLSESRSLADAARFATIAAALSVTRRGAQPSLPTRDEVQQFESSLD